MGLFDSLFGGEPDVPAAPNYAPQIAQATNLQTLGINNNNTATGYAASNYARVPGQDANADWAQEQAQAAQGLAREQFDWAKQTYAENKGQTDKIVNMFTDQASKQFANADADRARYDSDYVPLAKAQVDEANNYNSDERKDLMRGRAISDVSQQFESQRQNTMRDLESFGINPGAVRYAALDTGFRASQAAAQAAAANQSDLATEATARDLRDKALAQGNLLPGQVAGETGVGTNLGTGATNTTLAQTASGANTMGKATDYGQLGQGWENAGTSSFNAGTSGANSGTSALSAGTQALGTGVSALNSSTNATGQGYANQMSQFDAEKKNSSGVGSLLGLGASAAMNYFAPGSSSFMEDGGEVPGRTVPVEASPSGGRKVDDVSARLTPGEFVLPVDVAAWYGEDKLQRMILKAREAKSKAGAKPEVRRALPQQPSFHSALPGR